MRVPAWVGWSRLGRRERRVIALGAVVILLALGYRFGFHPYRLAVSTQADAVAAQRAALARERGMVRSVSELGSRAEALEAEIERWSGRLLPTADLEAPAVLSDRLTSAAGEAGLLLQSVEGRESSPAGNGIVRHRMVVQALGDLEGVLRFLHALEHGRLLVDVARVDLSPSPVRTADPGEARALRLAAEVQGFSLDRADSEADESSPLRAQRYDDAPRTVESTR